ncbi:hypothetical protein LshimejAT787_1200730 [Lyophyllum shimeji]|uniref:F-box domain-containing protein n=1 Tax=Lyophyllum shimeji TaxID=47721 RepID=A0A9P3UPD2_LYOSH|nr:hypothetical protein LshimejAT787_1200730 [Lyophyllum shimeji]
MRYIKTRTDFIRKVNDTTRCHCVFRGQSPSRTDIGANALRKRKGGGCDHECDEGRCDAHGSGFQTSICDCRGKDQLSALYANVHGPGGVLDDLRHDQGVISSPQRSEHGVIVKLIKRRGRWCGTHSPRWSLEPISMRPELEAMSGLAHAAYLKRLPAVGATKIDHIAAVTSNLQDRNSNQTGTDVGGQVAESVISALSPSSDKSVSKPAFIIWWRFLQVRSSLGKHVQAFGKDSRLMVMIIPVSGSYCTADIVSSSNTHGCLFQAERLDRLTSKLQLWLITITRNAAKLPMNSAPSPTLPQELINSIVESLPRDFDTLRACSVVSRSFRDPSQRLIFREANLLVPSGPDAGHDEEEPPKQSLYETLASSARLSSYVSDFVLRIANPSTSTAYSAPSPLQLDWETLQSELKSDILHLLRSPTLKRLELDQIRGFPLPAFRHCPQLLHLRMKSNNKRAVAFDTTSEPLPPSDSCTSQGSLKVLEVTSPVISQHLQVALAAPSSRLSLSSLLRYETLISSEEGIHHCGAILQLSAASLEEFVVDVGPSIRFEQQLELHKLHCLSRTRFRSMTYESLWYICDVLETVPEKSRTSTHGASSIIS